MAANVVKIPFPPNVDHSWEKKLYDYNNGSCSEGFHVGAYIDVTQYEAFADMSRSINMRIPDGSTIQALSTKYPTQLVVRSVLPGEQIDLSNTETDVALITQQSWGDIFVQMIWRQRGWWLSTLAETPPHLWGNGNNHPVWRAWAERPDPERLWYVAIRKTLPDAVNDIPSYYFPEAELRF